MSRLTDLLAQAKAQNPSLGKELEREFKALANRRAFGLNFERHKPESVELPGRNIRKGDKVRVLPERGSLERADQRLWKVQLVRKSDGNRVADLKLLETEYSEMQTVGVEDLIVIAEMHDYVYPGLVSTGKVERGDEKPYHTVINGENFHSLQALTYTHKGKVDAIYIDPPYNTGAKDWKYNNDYVESEDLYRHSKWLAFIERRLLLAKALLNPNCSTLIVSIDEKEYLRLGLLLEQIFPDAEVVMVTSVISAKGAVRPGRFSRVEEHIFFVFFGAATVKWWENNMLPSAHSAGIRPEAQELSPIPWLLLRRREPTSIREARPNQFYPIYVNIADGSIHSIGDAITPDIDKDSIAIPNGTIPLWPLKPNGTEMLWGLTPDVLRRNWRQGYVKVTSWRPDRNTGSVKYLQTGIIRKIRAGDIIVTGRASDGSVEGHNAEGTAHGTSPKRVWNMRSHNAETGGTNLVSSLLPDRRFPFPKSLYAVEDVLRFVLADNRDAVVLDFFAGSGTTAHSVMRLNKQDGGHRQCISVTNNEVGADEQRGMRREGLRPGDQAWEQWGICDYITKPRVTAAITGETSEGQPISGDYRFTDEFPMAEGFEENAEFFTLTYETPVSISHNRAFTRIAPLLWMKAGCEGRRIDVLPEAGWEVTDTYGLLTDLDAAAPFFEVIKTKMTTRMAFIVTDDDRRFQSVAQSLPDSVEAIRLYESYLTNFHAKRLSRRRSR